jgi:hypothetical protein
MNNQSRDMFLYVMGLKRKNGITADELALERLEELLWALNEGPETDQMRVRMERVENVISLLARLDEDAPSLKKAQLLAGLRKALSRYRWVSYITPSTKGVVVLNRVADHMQISRADLWENEAVRDLLTALPRLDIGRRPYIRRCESPKCRRWFIAPRSDKRTCSQACHQWLYDNRSPEQKAHKAAKMRDHRKREKARQERQDKRLGFTKGKRRVASGRLGG